MPHRTFAALVLLTLSCSALGHDVDRGPRWGSYSLELVDEYGSTLPTYEHRGRTYVLGSRGQRYFVRVHNRSGQRIEVVASVDGRDVLDGEPSAWEKRGYLVEPWSDVSIDGFRLSDASVAAFRFSDVKHSYAARMGDSRDVGVIGVAIFPERPPRTRHRYSHAPAYGGEAKRESSEPGEQFGAAPGAPAAPRASDEMATTGKSGRSRPGLGTEFAEEHSSFVQQVPFERKSSHPDALLTLRYNDRAGLSALGIDVDGRWVGSHDLRLRESATPFRRSPPYAKPPPGWSH